MAVFLRKEREWGAEGAEDGKAEVQLAFPEVITSLDEIHHVGTLAQVGDSRGPTRSRMGGGDVVHLSTSWSLWRRGMGCVPEEGPGFDLTPLGSHPHVLMSGGEKEGGVMG